MSSKEKIRQRAQGRTPDGSFADLASQYVELYAKKHNKSWKQAEKLVASYLLPRWGKLKASDITRADVRAVMMRIAAPITANQVLASASAIFTWATRQEILTVNPCEGSTGTRPATGSGCYPTPRSQFWDELDNRRCG